MSCSVNLKNISYKNDKSTLFENIELNLGHEEKVVIIGSNGVGKSTLLRIIAGLEYKYKGNLYLFHNRVETKKEYEKYRSDIGYLPQDVSNYFLCPTVIEDIIFSLRVRGENQKESQIKAEEILNNLDIEHLKDRIISDLSRGEQKIVALASILVTKPKILLLDEPTNDLDDKSCLKIIDILNSLKKSMIIVSHQKDFIDKLSSNIYRLENKELKKI